MKQIQSDARGDGEGLHDKSGQHPPHKNEKYFFNFFHVSEHFRKMYVF